MLRSFPRHLVLLSGLLVACGKPSEPARDASSAHCAPISLRPAASGPSRSFGFAAGAMPLVLVDLKSVTGTERVKASVSACEPGSEMTSFEQLGETSFTLPETLFAAFPKEGCVRVNVRALRGDVLQGTATAEVRRGDYALKGQLVAPTELGPALKDKMRSRIEVKLPRFSITTQSDETGAFEVTNVPAGPVLRVRAEVLNRKDLLRGDVSPDLELGDSRLRASLVVPLYKLPPAVDEFEPDGTIAEAAPHPLLMLGQSQVHSITNRDDIDLIPFSATAGQSYRISAQAFGPRPGDVGLAVVDSAGNVLRTINDFPGDFVPQPVLTFQPTSTAIHFVRLKRFDDEISTLPVKVTMTSANGCK